MEDLPSLDRLTCECELKWVRKNEETLVVGVGRMRLNRAVFFFQWLPILAVFERCFDEDTITVSREVSATDNLADKVHFWLVVSPNTQVMLLFGRNGCLICRLFEKLIVVLALVHF